MWIVHSSVKTIVHFSINNVYIDRITILKTNDLRGDKKKKNYIKMKKTVCI